MLRSTPWKWTWSVTKQAKSEGCAYGCVSCRSFSSAGKSMENRKGLPKGSAAQKFLSGLLRC
eukprot:5162516-Alexandrium_andersonii.AAC.1